MAGVAACSFCGIPSVDAKQTFENEELTSAICAVCVASFAQNLVDAEDDSEE